jgi:methionyl-tRNA formyltransferase
MPLTIAYTGRIPECRALLDGFEVVAVPITRPVDLGISVIGTHLFTRDEIALARYGIVNLHLAPLPEYRGRYSTAHAVANGDTSFGVTLHYVDEGIDTGPIIEARRFPAPREIEALRELARAEGIRLFADVLPALLAAAEAGRRLPASVQDERRARYYDRHSVPA